MLPCRWPRSEAERARVTMEQGSVADGDDPRELLATAEVAGQLAATYLLVPVPFGLWLIDQHVAHERVLYEKALARWEQSQVVAQQLPHTLYAPAFPALAATLMDHLDAIEAMGFGVEPFGGNDFLLRAVPPKVTGRPEPVLTQIVEGARMDRLGGGSIPQGAGCGCVGLQGGDQSGGAYSPK